jgi:hypothetical protein
MGVLEGDQIFRDAAVRPATRAYCASQIVARVERSGVPFIVDLASCRPAIFASRAQRNSHRSRGCRDYNQSATHYPKSRRTGHIAHDLLGTLFRGTTFAARAPVHMAAAQPF